MTLNDPIEVSAQLEMELLHILDFWKNNTKDMEFGGFVGRIDHNNHIIKKAPKGIILNTRILWTFSRANNFYKDNRYDAECELAFDYLYDYFRDADLGGVYWEVDYKGCATNTKKQVYAQAFCIYALAEYYKYCTNTKALTWAMELFDLLEAYSYDPNLKGYIEAFDEKWGSIEDLRLSDKELNAPKTTNTHLHILEAYTTLYEVTKDPKVKNALLGIYDLFLNRIFKKNNHLDLFFTNDWQSLSSEISFGHDIETAWLLIHGAKTIGDPELQKKTEDLLHSVTNTFVVEALDQDYGVINAIDPMTEKLDNDKHWWPQAEAMVGLVYAWKITNDDSFFNMGFKVWQFIKNHIIDHKNGEWFFRVDVDGAPYPCEDKVGPWKCPYHNSRALIEVISMIKG
ncbi:AGE family epimerase/isomerase [Maribacter sp. ANRC-HE7]|uniref:Cellobiose 2-epimerase n=1 Tax=Maribacter aquimaris TaxID=2737171 RepID=A0ABR7UZ45_9FLAO|nr:AGE family epimerase/isomerase [Maribacter aquimaris]MBD0776900.1 AGE family epimerase/isomerase [Maribacter aquimaris]